MAGVLTMETSIDITERFFDYVFDWDYEQYLSIGGYGSGKSYAAGEKVILKLLQETRTALVVREVYDTMENSCYALLLDILNDMDMIASDDNMKEERKYKVVARKSPLRFMFPNGSRIIFKGMDKPEKTKSMHNVSIVWLEECSEIKYAGVIELLGRVRHPKLPMHFIFTCNPVARENWVYEHFFCRIDDEGRPTLIVDEFEFYERRTLVHDDVYYHHSVPDDNPHLQPDYIKRLDSIKQYDEPLWHVARHGRFGAAGTRVLPQFEVAKNAEDFVAAVRAVPLDDHYFGMDFGFEESYNAVLSMAVDPDTLTLYIYDEIYVNGITDPEMAARPDMQRLRLRLNNMFMNEEHPVDKMISADCADPKAVKFYRDMGFRIRSCHKFTRLSQTRKMKRFRRIVCSPKCRNTIRELSELTYKKDAKGKVIYDEFNIDPHTFSAMWYGLDQCHIVDIKDEKRHSRSGAAA